MAAAQVQAIQAYLTRLASVQHSSVLASAYRSSKFDRDICCCSELYPCRRPGARVSRLTALTGAAQHPGAPWMRTSQRA